MRRFVIKLTGEGCKSNKVVEDYMDFLFVSPNFSEHINKLGSDRCVLAKQYSKDANVFEIERELRKIIRNHASKIQWALLEDGSYLAVKFTTKRHTLINDTLREMGFDELEL